MAAIVGNLRHDVSTEVVVGAAIQNFPARKKEEFWFHVRKPNKASRPSHIPFLPRPKNRRSHSTKPPLPKSTPVILLLPFTWASLRFW